MAKKPAVITIGGRNGLRGEKRERRRGRTREGQGGRKGRTTLGHEK